jgi:lactoylglutathione lyase
VRGSRCAPEAFKLAAGCVQRVLFRFVDARPHQRSAVTADELPDGGFDVLLRKLDFPEMSFSLYFLAVADSASHAPVDQGERTAWTFSQAGILELTHNWGTEINADFKYHDGNAQPQGFGHICFSVPDLDAAVKWFDDNQVVYVKRPEQGKMKDVAFIKDPDGYWIEVVEPGRLKKLGA